MFKERFNYFKEKIVNKENFSLTRYGDGERAIIENIPINESTQAFTVDKWKYSGESNHFSNDLKQTCFHREDNYFYGVSCQCCDINSKLYYQKIFENHNLTYANLFVNSNYKLFLEFINILDRDVFLICNIAGETSQYPFNIKQKLLIENNCIEWYNKNKETFLLELKNISTSRINELFFISAGPLSEIIIHNLYKNNPNNCYIDVGSSLDVFTHKKITRPYQIKDNYYYNKECIL